MMCNKIKHTFTNMVYVNFTLKEFQGPSTVMFTMGMRNP